MALTTSLFLAKFRFFYLAELGTPEL